MSPSRPSSNPLHKLLAIGAMCVCAGVLYAQNAPAPAPAPPPAEGDRQIVITGQASDRIAVPDCVPRDDAAREVCKTITEVLKKDLRFEELSIVPENLYAMLPALKPDAPNFEDWKSVNAHFLVITKAEVSAGQANVEMRLHYVSTGQSVLAKRYTNKADNPRALAHQAADEILAVAQIKGVARTKLAFQSDRDSVRGKKTTKEIYICDYDGFNVRRVTVNGSINQMPAWNPDGRSLAYVSFRTPIPELFFAWIYEGRSTGFPAGKGGQVIAHSFSPDGKKIAFATTRGGGGDLWAANADGTGPQRLTETAATETAPTWSPTGREIAFTRSIQIGAPQIYVMDSEGLNVRKVPTIGGYNDAPAWNPAREFPEIAYTSRIEGNFEVAVIDLTTNQVRQITQGRGRCEYPTWAPNGRHLAFSCERSGRWQLTLSDRMGRSLETLAAGPGNNVQPDWGPAPAQ